jgi:hypothetical protein
MSHTVDEHYERMVELRAQLKLAMLFARIEDDLRELRRNLTTAQFAREGEKGFIPQDALNSGRRFKFPVGEDEARLEAAEALDTIEEGLDNFETDKWGTVDLDLCSPVASAWSHCRKRFEKRPRNRVAPLSMKYAPHCHGFMTV